LALKITAFSALENFLFILNFSLWICVHSQQGQNIFPILPSPYQYTLLIAIGKKYVPMQSVRRLVEKYTKL